ncbi:MAG: endonuclease [Thermoleophilia bacterium]|nr:endonuclease [Thermoleophilia bacterium]
MRISAPSSVPMPSVVATPSRGAWPTPAATRPVDGGGTDTYYARAEGLEGDALLTALRRIISGQHALDYDAARNALFGTVDDPTSTDHVADIYSGKVFDGVSDNGSAAAHQLNTEHLWPQSLGATDEARSDLHHLMPADVATNGRRGNQPYGEVVQASWTGTPDADGHAPSMGKDAQGHIVFQPRPENRGDIARALLYFYTRYDADRTPRYANKEFLQELPTYERWNQEDPPDGVERARNDAIFALQGNRNPYVDRPEFVGLIGAAWGAAHLRR